MNQLTVVVSVGTDHHPFDRLIDSVVRWSRSRDEPIRLVVQHGSSAPSGVGEDHSLLARDDLLRAYQEAHLIVTQVGPGTIADVNAVRRRPIIVPRDPRRGEVVDGHQYDFGRLMDRLGYAWQAETAHQLHCHMDVAAGKPAHTYLEKDPPDATAAAAALAEIATLVVSRPRSALSMRRVTAMMRRPTVAPELVGGEGG